MGCFFRTICPEGWGCSSTLPVQHSMESGHRAFDEETRKACKTRCSQVGQFSLVPRVIEGIRRALEARDSKTPGVF